MAILAAKRAANTGSRVILATSRESADDALAKEAADHGVEVFRGSLDDVLSRFLSAIADYSDDAVIIRLTADNPIPDGALIDEVKREFLDRGLEYITTTDPASGLPYGVSIEMTRARCLRAIARDAAGSAREHVTSGVISRYGSEPFLGRSALKLSGYRVTVDSLDDYMTLRDVFEGVPNAEYASWLDLVEAAKTGPYQPSSQRPVPKIVMGTAQLGLDYGVSRAKLGTDSEREFMIKRAIGEGVSAVDTARVYGTSEAVIGRVLAEGWGGRFEVITKLDPLVGLSAQSQESEWRLATECSVWRSCVALGLERLDTLLVHRVQHLTVAGGAVWSQLCRMQREGVIGTLGASVQTPDELQLALSTENVDHIQLPCNLVDHRWKRHIPQLIAARQERGLRVHVRSIFLQGLLLSRNLGDWARAHVHQPEGIWSWMAKALAHTRRQNAADLCMAWAQAQEWIDGIVVGADNLTQLTENLELARNPALTAEELDYVDASRPQLAPETADPSRWLAR